MMGRESEPRLITTSLQGKERFVPGLSLCLDLALLDPDAFARHEDLIQALQSRSRRGISPSNVASPRHSGASLTDLC